MHALCLENKIKKNRRERNSNIFWKSVVYAVAKCVQDTKYTTL